MHWKVHEPTKKSYNNYVNTKTIKIISATKIVKKTA